MPTFAVVVLSQQGARHLAGCLQSVAWADEILLLHAGGGAPALEGGEFPALRAHALAAPSDVEKYSAEIRSDWVLLLWGDERVDGRLAAELQALRRGGPPNPAGYRIRVRSRILGEWIEGSVSGPSPAVRLGRNAKEIPLGWWEKENPASDIAGGWIEDYGCADLGDAVERVQEISRFWAGRLLETAAAPGPGKAVFHSLGVFWKMLFSNRFFARGLAGTTLPALASYAVLLSGAKLWEARRARKG